MNRTIKSIIITSILAICFAFTSEKKEGLEITYGVSSSNPSSVELRLTKDFEFTYRDYSDPGRKIDVKGTYTLQNEKVVLTTSQKQVRFHDKWKLTDNRGAARSRKGLAFYRLIRLK